VRIRPLERAPFGSLSHGCTCSLPVLSWQRAHFFPSIRAREIPSDARAGSGRRERPIRSWTSDIARVRGEKETGCITATPQRNDRIVGQAARLALPGSTVSPTEGPPPLLRPSPSDPRPLCQWCRDNLLFTSHPATASAAFYSERTNERTRPLPKKLTSRNPTWHRFVRGASPSFSLLALEFARRTAQSASSCPLVSRVSGKKPSSHGRPMQDEGRDQDIGGERASCRCMRRAWLLRTRRARFKRDPMYHVTIRLGNGEWIWF